MCKALARLYLPLLALALALRVAIIWLAGNSVMTPWSGGGDMQALVLGYAVLTTFVHTPFVMNTRIRAPLIDPLIAVLAGGCCAATREEPHEAV